MILLVLNNPLAAVLSVVPFTVTIFSLKTCPGSKGDNVAEAIASAMISLKVEF